MDSFKLVSPRDFIPRTFDLFMKKDGIRYNRTSFVKDCIAGITVGVVALPLSMAFSIAAGGTPAQGLYTAIFAGFLISFLGGSRYQIGGPTGAFVVIIFGVIAQHGMTGLMLATILAGIMLVVMGLTGIGVFIKFIPYPVTTGFTTGIGLLIFSQQIKDFFGLPIVHSSPDFIRKWMEYIRFFPLFDPSTLATGAGTIAVILLVRKFFPRIPGAVAGVVTATVICALFSLPLDTVGSRFGGIPSSLPVPAFPSFIWRLVREVLPDAFTLAFLAAIESLLSAVVADGMTGDRHNANMELVAQGVGNIASALFGGIPATGAIARTATNIKAGAVSPVAGMVHALTLVLFILFLAPAASLIPLASLSAVLMVVAWDMSNLPRFVRIIRRAPRSDAIVLLSTFILTVVVDLTFAVEVGVVLAVFLFLRRMIEVSDIKPGGSGFGSELVFGNRGGGDIRPESPKNIEIYEITGPFFFGVADMLQNLLRQVVKTPDAFILRMRDVPAIDSTGIAALESFLVQCRRRKIRLVLCEIREQPAKALEKSGFSSELGKENIVGNLEEAVGLVGK
ncbi:MAG: STAS domain-containing protein [Spirochaetaceae bacterium]|jgi:SulP family sulfate permease|nr:STAS domain-containing protein [Spirochaetaceae bacterium]